MNFRVEFLDRSATVIAERSAGGETIVVGSTGVADETPIARSG